MIKKSYKNGKYIEFAFDDGKVCKYDLSSGLFYGKSGKIVKCLSCYFRNIDLIEFIETFEDEDYRRYLEFCRKNINKKIDGSIGEKYTNISTFLSKIINYSMYEQYFSAGILKINNNLNKKIGDCPKGLIKICKKLDLELDDNLIDCYNDYQNEFFYVLNNDTISMDKKIFLKHFLIDNYKYRNYIRRYRTYDLLEYGYKFSDLYKYYDKIYTCEALDLELITENLYDYYNMMKCISDRVDRYPKNLLTTHQIAVRNYNRLTKKYEEEIFEERINKKYEYEFKDYVFIYPKKTTDIKDEAVQQNNCVASYIKKVIDGKSNIIFLRKKKTPDKSLVTIEVNENYINQAYRAYNQPLHKEEKEALSAYQKYLNKTFV